MAQMDNWDWHGKKVMAYCELTEEEVLFVKSGEDHKVPKWKKKMFIGRGAFDRADKWRSEVKNVSK